MVSHLLDFHSHLHQVEMSVPWLAFVSVPVAALARMLAGALADGLPVYSSGWTPYVLVVRPDLSIPDLGGKRKPLLRHRF